MTTGKRGKMEGTRLRTATADMVEPEISRALGVRLLTGLVLGYALLAFGTAFEVIKGDPKLVVERCELVSKVVRLTTGSDPI